ncbi:MAG TPA: glyoxylate/hydroxypyruvate reductase A [Stellaceae bacterium]|nr:glyoxylate/hydroxypyruvate reductase A [Stellaceae bacterium]
MIAGGDPGADMAILVYTSAASAARWRPHLAAALPGRDIRFWPELGEPAAIEYAIVWRPEPGLLASLPKLRLIVSLGAGVDHVLRDPSVPQALPLMRLVDPYMTRAMSEYVVLQVLRLHRQDIDYLAQQRAGEWRQREQPNAEERTVGILGFGTLGQDAGRKLAALGFAVAGWSRSAKAVPGFASFAGAAGLAEIAARSDILVSLLPATAATENILDAALFARLPRGAALVNAGRGNQLVETDLVAALDSGQLSGAVLDVFRDEPLPASHPFWRHPRIVVTPHVAAETNPATAAPIIARAIADCAAGRPVANLVDRARGY